MVILPDSNNYKPCLYGFLRKRASGQYTKRGFVSSEMNPLKVVLVWLFNYFFAVDNVDAFW